jgi:anhydro-N-acetylmuramic acid kinase
MNGATDPTDLFIGIMSGTSLDGIDVVIARFADGVECVSHHATDFAPEFRSVLYDCATADKIEIDTLVRAHFVLAEVYAEGVTAALKEAGLQASAIRAIGSHGQTVRHLPLPTQLTSDSQSSGATFQLGSGAALAALTGIDVISDFRSADVALGGQGAPLVPMFDAVFLRDKTLDRVALNIGGIANVTMLPALTSDKPILAFDTGPGNMIIDELMRRFFSKPYDEDGNVAASGMVDEGLLTKMLLHDYFSSPAPKSTGRELFGGRFLAQITNEIENGRITPTNAVATATELTARSTAFALTGWHAEILASGGGAKNLYLLKRLHELTPGCTVRTTDSIGIIPEAKEGLAFAFFAKAFLDRTIIHLPQTTGASRAVVLGSLSLGSGISTSR